MNDVLYRLNLVRREMRAAHEERRLGARLQFRWELYLALVEAGVRKMLRKKRK